MFKDRQAEAALQRAVGDVQHALGGLTGKDKTSQALYDQAAVLREQLSQLLEKVKSRKAD